MTKIIQMPLAAALPSPPYAADVRASGWRFILDMERIEQSTTWLVTPLHLRPWLLMLWAKSWQQIPCGSLPNDIEHIAALIGLTPEQFDNDRAVLMRKWYLCRDGRWYHPFITKQVVEMLDARKVAAERKDNWRKRQREYVAVLHDPSGRAAPVETLGGGTRDNPDVTRDKPDVTRESDDVPATSSSSSSSSSLKEPTPDGVGSDFALSAQSPTTTSRRKAKAPKPAPPAFDGENEHVFNGRNVLALAAAWQLPTPWGDDAESLGWKAKDILHESEKFRQYWTVGKGAGTTRSLRGWRQSWSNWLARAAKEKR
jgi:hypothetical protein